MFLVKNTFRVKRGKGGWIIQRKHRLLFIVWWNTVGSEVAEGASAADARMDFYPVYFGSPSAACNYINDILQAEGVKDCKVSILG